MAEFVPMLDKFMLPLKKVNRYRGLLYWYFRIQRSGLFDRAWYLENNPDVARANVNPLLHYIRYGAFEGRDPGPRFSSRWYLDTYKDVKQAGLNPLIHFIKFGRKEGRAPRSPEVETAAPYTCPVCRKGVTRFVPLPAFYTENLQKYGFPYKREEGETINFEQYSCPHCGASDRDRLSACYFDERLPLYPPNQPLLLLDIAPSGALSYYLRQQPQIQQQTADLMMEGVDQVVDISNMPEVHSNYYDMLICSHVLEHVNDDRKALAELYRVLKPGGWAILMVPIALTLEQIDEDPQVTDVAERWRRFGQDDHVRLYNRSGFVERIEAAGFSVKQLGVEHFGAANFQRYAITPTSILYVAEKPAVQAPKARPKRSCDFFFIVGTGRCGTTLLAQILNAHSRICVPSELQIAFETANNGARLAEVFAARDNLRFRAADYIRLIDERCPHHLDAYYDYRTFFYELPYPIPSLQWLLTELYTDIAYSQGKTIFAEQTPWYGQNIKLLDELFPQAKFIHIVRDGRDVAISFTRTPWWHKDINLNLAQWAREAMEIEQAAPLLGSQRLITVRYEDLVGEPEKVTQRVCRFLEVPFEPGMLLPENHIDYGRFSKIPGQADASPAYLKWRGEKKSAFFSDNVYGWKRNPAAVFDRFSETVVQSLQHFGYEA